jgi:hypothetical protein
MSSWGYFWAAWLVISGVAFAVITVIVAVKGYRDLRAMFAGLSGKKQAGHE